MTGVLAGKRALIYGGGTGIGAGCAQAFLENGASAFISGRRRDKLEKAKSRLSAFGPVGLQEGDTGAEADVDRVTRAAIDFLGGIDTLVVSAGRSHIGSILECAPADFDDVIRTNLRGPFLAARAAAPHLVSAAPASMILLASVVATAAMKERVAYIASKTGVVGLARSMALDLADKGVRVNAVSPSLILTEMTRAIMASEKDPAAVMARREAQHPVGRLGRTEDIGSLAVYLASDASSWLTGQDIVIDGGLTLS
jgi:NAD(P)-dependent dehydrogenase (short-subunit alcohol dehydrogenase family)